MNVDSAHRRRWEIAEVVFGIPFLVSIALHFVIPISVAPGLLRQVSILVGIVLVTMGTGMAVLARREFAHFHQPTDPGRPTTEIIKTGVFALSRHPLYMGGVLVIAGVALALNMFWALITLPISIVACYYILIIPEERYLIARFGNEYTEYAAGVRRWLGRR